MDKRAIPKSVLSYPGKPLLSNRVAAKYNFACSLRRHESSLYLTAAQQCGKIRPNGRIEDRPDDFILAALAKPPAFSPWLTFLPNRERSKGHRW